MWRRLVGRGRGAGCAWMKSGSCCNGGVRGGRGPSSGASSRSQRSSRRLWGAKTPFRVTALHGGGGGRRRRHGTPGRGPPHPTGRPRRRGGPDRGPHPRREGHHLRPPTGQRSPPSPRGSPPQAAHRTQVPTLAARVTTSGRPPDTGPHPRREGHHLCLHRRPASNLHVPPARPMCSGGTTAGQGAPFAPSSPPAKPSAPPTTNKLVASLRRPS